MFYVHRLLIFINFSIVNFISAKVKIILDQLDQLDLMISYGF